MSEKEAPKEAPAAPMKAVSLSPTAHKGLRVKQDGSVEYLNNTHIVKVYGPEYAKASIDYPIVFVKDPETQEFGSILIWGVEPGENVFIEKGNKWSGGFMPASVRCFPFTMSTSPNGEEDRLYIGIYEDSSLLSKEDGELIFNDDGTETQWMTKIKEFLVQVYEQEHRTKNFVAKLDSLGLLIPQTLEIQLPGSEKKEQFTGLYIVDRAKLDELSVEDFQELRKANALEAIYAHLASLENIKKVVLKKQLLNAEA